MIHVEKLDKSYLAISSIYHLPFSRSNANTSQIYNSKTGFYSNSSVALPSRSQTPVLATSPPSSERAPSQSNGTSQHPLDVDKTLEQIVSMMHVVSLTDSQHVPSKILLAQFYLWQDEEGQAEFWLERAIKKSKCRGMSNGYSVSLISHGSTSAWGWKSWHLLTQVMQKQGKKDKAAECIMFALRLMQCTGVRGFECLRRMAAP